MGAGPSAGCLSSTSLSQFCSPSNPTASTSSERLDPLIQNRLPGPPPVLCHDWPQGFFCSPRAPHSAAPSSSPSTSAPKLAVAVVRHGERLDAVDPQKWFRSTAGRRFPFDCPLTSKGRKQAAEVAKELSDRSSSSFSMVVTSPFIRCVETSVEICRVLDIPLCVDLELGEVFGPSCFGQWELPGPDRRTIQEVLNSVPEDVKRAPSVVGDPPQWPETITEARLRMVVRVEQYAERASRLGGVGFVLVTHGDCVAAVLSLALAGSSGSLTGQRVEKVDYCSHVLLERTFSPGELPVGLMDPTAGWSVQYGRAEVRQTGMVWHPEAFDEEVDMLKVEAEAVAAAREASGNQRLLTRRRSTTVLTSTLHRKISLEALQLSSPAGTQFKELMSECPLGKAHKVDEIDVEDFERLVS